MNQVLLTKQGCRTHTSWLPRAAVDIEVRMTTGMPLPQDSSSGVQNIHEVCIRRIQIPGVVGPGIEEYRGIQRGDPAQLALLRLQIVSHQTGDVGTHTVANEVQVVRLDATRMSGEVFDQLGDAQAAEPRSPVHLTQTRFLNGIRVVHYDDVVLAHTEVGLPQIGTGTQSPAAAESMDYDLGGMAWIEVRVVQGVRIQDIYELRLLLGASRVQIELDLRMRTAVRLLQARIRHIDLRLVLSSRHGSCHHSRILGRCMEDVRFKIQDFS